MTDTILRDCWTIICKKDAEFLATEYQPLSHIDPYLTHFDLSPIPMPAVMENGWASMGFVEPSFKDLTDDILYSLRNQIYTQMEPELVANWAEKLMRFCEIRYRTLKRRSLEKCKSRTAAQLHVLHLAAFLMDQSNATKDLRFLNTVLKLLDFRWVLEKDLLPKELGDATSRRSLALFQFRVLLTTEYAIDLLCKDGTR